MSDALTSASTPAPASTEAPSAPAEQAPQSAPASQPSSTPQQPTAERRQPVNLQEIPEFKNWQRQVNQTLAQYQQQAAAAAAELERQRMSGMDDLEQAQYRAAQYEAQLRQYQQQMEYNQLAYQRQADIQAIAAETGAPPELLEQAENFADAWRLATKHLKQNAETVAKTRAAELVERIEANAVDIGGGSASTPLTRNEQTIKKALQGLDSRALLRAALYGEE